MRQCVDYWRRTPVDDYLHSKLFFQYENFRRNKIQACHEFSCFGLFAKLFVERSKYNIFQSYEDIAGIVHSHLIFNNGLSVLQPRETKVHSQSQKCTPNVGSYQLNKKHNYNSFMTLTFRCKYHSICASSIIFNLKAKERIWYCTVAKNTWFLL